MRKAARRIVEKLRLNGHEAFFAGGWVRDFLLRRRPQDIDIATSATPEQVLKLFPHSTDFGARFGAVQVRVFGHPYDVVTFRSDGAYLDGRHPSTVSFSGPRQDALRRDFTINGLFYDPVASRVIDYVRGRADLQQKVVRTIGDPRERFEEDKLRMLRAVRFACSLSFEIASETWDAIKHLAPAIRQVSWERIRDELIKIVTGADPGRGLDLLHESGLLAEILPEVEALRGVEQPSKYHPEGDVFVHTREALSLLKRPSPALALGTLLHDVGKPATFEIRDRIRFHGHSEVGAQLAEEICRRLRISNEETERVVDLVRNHLWFINVPNMRESTLKRFLRQPAFPEHLELHRVDCLSSHGDLTAWRLCREKRKALEHEPVSPPPFVTGDDLISLGYQPGPIFKEILGAVEDLQLEGGLATKEEALDYIRRTFPVTETQNR
jgi:poly(A) polymerase